MSVNRPDELNDPKQIVTPYAFSVHENLLGMPLATPKRRFAAVLLDLFIAGFLSALGPLVLAGIASVFFFLIALRKKYDSWYRTVLRYIYASAGSVFMFLLAMTLIDGISIGSSDRADIPENVATLPGGNTADWTAFTKKAMNVDYGDSAKAAQQWEELAKEIQQATGVASSEEPEVQPLPDNAPQILRSYAAALESADSARIDSLEPLAAEIAARHQLADLRFELDQSDETIDNLEDQNEELAEIAENPGLLRILKQLADDTGLALGWAGLYFIICLAWWEGQTPGKKLLKLKVVRLNGKPLRLWHSFERFGGYAAGFATGLLGFFQVYWDPNRQAIHDKIAGTVVLDMREKRRKRYEHLHEGLDR